MGASGRGEWVEGMFCTRMDEIQLPLGLPEDFPSSGAEGA